MSVFASDPDHVVLKLRICQTALLQLRDQSFYHFLCNIRLSMVSAGVCGEEMGLSVCFTLMSVYGLGYGNNFN